MARTSCNNRAPLAAKEDPNRVYFETYVDRMGGVQACAEKLAIVPSTLYGVMNGYRGIGREFAKQLCAADPLLDANKLVWVMPWRRENRGSQKPVDLSLRAP